MYFVLHFQREKWKICYHSFYAVVVMFQFGIVQKVYDDFFYIIFYIKQCLTLTQSTVFPVIVPNGKLGITGNSGGDKFDTDF